MSESADIVIVGGGPVGSALVLALQAAQRNVVLLEARATDSGDARPLALSYGSRLILERLGVWPELAAAATPIRHIHVSQRGGFGRVSLHAKEAGLPELGYVVDYGHLARQLAQAASATAATCLGGATVTAWQGGDPARAEYVCAGDRQCITAPLLVIADGAANAADMRTVDYRQCAVTARITGERAHDHVAYERFTRHGPLALLPDGAGWALVWTTAPERAQQLCAVEPAAFLDELQTEFGGRAGHFTGVSGRAAYPLRLRQARHGDSAGVVRIGNAAQTLHPVAGQGFNLGLRDAWELGEHIIATKEADAPGSSAWLETYRARRRLDRRGSTGFTHALVQLFSNDLPPLRAARGLGLTLLGSLPPLKDFVVRRMTFGARG